MSDVMPRGATSGTDDVNEPADHHVKETEHSKRQPDEGAYSEWCGGEGEDPVEGLINELKEFDLGKPALPLVPGIGYENAFEAAGSDDSTYIGVVVLVL